MSSGQKIVAHISKYIKDCKGFERLLEKVKIVSAGNGCCVAEYTVQEDVSNIVGAMHGGYSATLVDAISSFALFSDEKHAVPSVSVDMHMTYMKAAKIGDEIIIDAKTTRAGKKLAYLTCDIKNKATGEVLVSGLHTKYILRDERSN